MANGNGRTMVAPVTANEMLNRTKVDIKLTINGFWKDLASMIRDYADKDKDLILPNGYRVDHLQKYDVGAAQMFSDSVSKIEQMQSTILNVYDMMLKLEKSIGQL